MTNKKKLEALIDALSDSLEIIAHNPVETEYVISLRHKYNEHYKELTGRYYQLKAIKPYNQLSMDGFEGLDKVIGGELNN